LQWLAGAGSHIRDAPLARIPGPDGEPGLFWRRQPTASVRL